MCTLFTVQPVNRLPTLLLHSSGWIHRLAVIAELDLAVSVFGEKVRTSCRRVAWRDMGLKWHQFIRLFMCLCLSFGAELFVLQVAIQKFKDQDIQNYNFCLLFCMGVKFGRWRFGRKGSWGFLRTWCWGEYLDRGGTRWQGTGENYITRSLTFRRLMSTIVDVPHR